LFKYYLRRRIETKESCPWGRYFNPLSHTERWVAAIGAFFGIFATTWVSMHYLSTGDAWPMVGSIGASAVLLFAVPHDQPTEYLFQIQPEDIYHALKQIN